MAEIEDGGPAFPLRWTCSHGADCNCGHCDGDGRRVLLESEGMTLRDWFAGQALAGLCAHSLGEQDEKCLAAQAYYQADAMLAERKESALCSRP